LAFIRNIKANNRTDDELVKLYRSDGDAHTLGLLYDRYMELVYGVCLKYLGEQEAARDAVMDIYEELTDKLLRHEVANFKSWLYSVARNHCLMKLRSRSSQKIVNIDEERMQFDGVSHLQEVQEREQQFVVLDECVQKLPAEQKKVIELFYLQQQCYNDIVTQTGFEWNKVRSLVQNGRRNLKICMEKTKTIARESSG
jgi:RNA polymerase sigma factor (sigma-70 family)